jgi:cobalt/nickel transport system permease protein
MLRFPSKLVTLLALTYRFIFVMYERVFTSTVSLRVRKPPSMTAITLWCSYAGLLTSAIISAERRSQKVWMSLKSRGFDGVFPVTEEFRWKAKDTAALALCVIAAIAVLLLDSKLWGYVA